MFDLAGEYIKGPSPAGMDRYDLKQAGNDLVVDTAALHAGPDRGVELYKTPPKGPGCIGKG